MSISNIDAELEIKVIEAFKELLKVNEIELEFEVPGDNIHEASSIIYGDDTFRLTKEVLIEEGKIINEKYYRFIREKTLHHTDEMNLIQEVNFIKNKTKHLFLLRPFLGKKVIDCDIIIYDYRLYYNNIIIVLTKKEYDKLNYYIKYVYKIQQIYKLNSYIGIEQSFNIVFDDDSLLTNMYNSMSDNFKDFL